MRSGLHHCCRTLLVFVETLCEKAVPPIFAQANARARAGRGGTADAVCGASHVRQPCERDAEERQKTRHCFVQCSLLAVVLSVAASPESHIEAPDNCSLYRELNGQLLSVIKLLNSLLRQKGAATPLSCCMVEDCMSNLSSVQSSFGQATNIVTNVSKAI